MFKKLIEFWQKYSSLSYSNIHLLATVDTVNDNYIINWHMKANDIVHSNQFTTRHSIIPLK